MKIEDFNTAKLEHSTLDGDQMIAKIARVSNPANQDNHETAPRLIRYLIKNNHWSPFQMASMCIEVTTTRDIGRQILRHMSAIGYQEFSGRYAAYESLNSFRECRFQHATNRQLSTEPETPEQLQIASEWNLFIESRALGDQADYQYWLSRGVAKECVRAILPEGLVPTTMYLRYSIRTWLHYIEERVKEGVQKEHRIVALACRDILKETYPNTYEAYFNK